MSENLHIETRKGSEYSGSPAPFAFFLILFIIFIALAALVFPDPLAAMFSGVAFLCLLVLPFTVAINKEWEEAIILRFGKFQRLVGPGFFFKWPLAESFLKQDKRIITLDVARQEVMTKDNISVSIDAVVFMRVVNTKDSLVNIQNLWNSVMKHAQTTMRDVVGNVELDDLLARREEIAERIEQVVEGETQGWGVDIISVKLQNVELPEDMKRVIARQAEAEREKRAVIIKSEGELTAATNLEKAVQQMSNRAMYLRTLSSLEDISYDPSNTIVFALPMDVVKGEIIGLSAFAKASGERSTERLPRREPREKSEQT
ncbi:MAG: SPFH domain-containing protein [Candidatus Bathyarchaeia archaeon]|jgi:regulator of protease activity HflC (stomatin/prohibitin superfamily)|nr:slipin family protein [Candidatus Bathyarchaeota archaeon A05DMB-4]MDH7595330.1 SPFH domain-containing protein [Candidatus Bathyarchaeota archaeon]